MRGSWRAGHLALLRHPVALMRPGARVAAAALAWRATHDGTVCQSACAALQACRCRMHVQCPREPPVQGAHRKLQPPLVWTPRANPAPQAPPKRPDFVAVRGAAATSLRNPLSPLDSVTGQCIPCARLVSGGVMKCVACGAGMRLMQVETDTVAVCGIERHIFRCSACPQGAQRLMFNRARMSSIHLPDAAAARPEPPAIKLQAAHVAPPSGGWTRAIEKLSSRQTALKERKPTDRISKRLSALKAPNGTPIALRTRVSGRQVLDLDQRNREASSQANRARTYRNGQSHRYGRRIQPHVGRSAPRCDDGRAAGVADAPRAARVLSVPSPRLSYALRLSGTLPPLSASLVMTCRCSQRFISAEPSRAPE